MQDVRKKCWNFLITQEFQIFLFLNKQKYGRHFSDMLLNKKFKQLSRYQNKLLYSKLILFKKKNKWKLYWFLRSSVWASCSALKCSTNYHCGQYWFFGLIQIKCFQKKVYKMKNRITETLLKYPAIAIVLKLLLVF